MLMEYPCCRASATCSATTLASTCRNEEWLRYRSALASMIWAAVFGGSIDSKATLPAATPIGTRAPTPMEKWRRVNLLTDLTYGFLDPRVQYK